MIRCTIRSAACGALLALAACSGASPGSSPPSPGALAMPHSVSPQAVAPAPMVRRAILAPTAMGSPRTGMSDIQGLNWTQIPGSASQAAPSPDGSLWVLSDAPAGADKYIWHYIAGSWTNVGGLASRIAVAPNGTLYAINSGGGAYAYSGGNWNGLGGGASDITIAADGSLYVLTNAGGADRAVWHNVGGTWTQVGGSGTRIAASWDPGTYAVYGGTIAPNGLYILNSSGAIYYENANGTFVQLPGGGSTIAPTTGGGVFVLGYPGSSNGNSIYYNNLSSPGWAAQSGAAVSLAAGAANLYVVGASGAIYSAPLSQSAQLTMDASNPGPAISHDVMGAALATWSDITLPQVGTSLGSLGIGLVRWPGGSESDAYHWESGGSVCNAQGYVYPPSTFDAFMADDVKPNNLDVAVTVNYGSNKTCNGGGDPAEAAAWVAYAKAHGDNVRYWTVGNEVFGSWEYDLHATAHDATTYATAVTTGYYPQMKAADPNAQVGVVVAGSYQPSWDTYVLKNAKFDFVEMHYYAQGPGNETDAYLLGQGVTDFADALASTRAAMNAAGLPGTMPIYVGELNSVYANPGKQTVSITNGLFAGMAVAEMMKQGVQLSTWWLAFGGCNTGTNNSASLYGWQNFGAYTLFSDGNGECGSNIPLATPFPPARAYQLLSQFAPVGSRLIGMSLASGVTNVRAYAASNPSGYALLAFNLDQSTAKTFTVALNGQSRGTFAATQTTYGKQQYDDSKTNVWTGPVTTSLGTVGTSFSVTLPPWSMSVVTLR